MAFLNGSSDVNVNGDNASVIDIVLVTFIFSSPLFLKYPLPPTIFGLIVVCLFIPTVEANPVAWANILTIELSYPRFSILYALSVFIPTAPLNEIEFLASISDNGWNIDKSDVVLDASIESIIADCLINIEGFPPRLLIVAYSPYALPNSW